MKVHTRACVIVLVILLMSSYQNPVHAIQTGIRLGIFQTQADTREDTEFSVGVDLLIHRWGRTDISLAGNWLSIHEKNGAEANLYPVMFNFKYRLRDYGSSFIYVGAGGGVYFSDSNITTMGLKNEAKGAWNSILGVEFTGPKYMSSFIEGGYMASEDPGKSGLWHLQWGIRY
ncbi:MAG: hypothetical protein V2G42_00230 [bacterium JZ-2024 1]